MIRLTILLLIFGVASAESLVHVADAVNPCAASGCRYYEWRIKELPNIRYIASGYEDGIDYSLYRVNEDGARELLLRVNPIVVDDQGRYWWGYPWVTTGIVLTTNGEQVLLHATNHHDIERDGVISVPAWQRSLPALLLKGHKGKWNIRQDGIEFETVTLEALLALAKAESE